MLINWRNAKKDCQRILGIMSKIQYILKKKYLVTAFPILLAYDCTIAVGRWFLFFHSICSFYYNFINFNCMRRHSYLLKRMMECPMPLLGHSKKEKKTNMEFGLRRINGSIQFNLFTIVITYSNNRQAVKRNSCILFVILV